MQGRLGQPDDIFYLTLDEVQQLAAGKAGVGDVLGLVATRRAEMVQDAKLDLPDVFLGDDMPAFATSARQTQEWLVGIQGSSGMAEGSARIVLDPSAAPIELTRQDILVVPFTDMSWTLLFAGVGGIVAETGGQLCHGAIVAREYGLPAVVGVKNATRRIQEGQHIVVDGTLGRVYLS
jgi:phosphoenolpyruvate synthase/pyruvate phosphate dikinase